MLRRTHSSDRCIAARIEADTKSTRVDLNRARATPGLSASARGAVSAPLAGRWRSRCARPKFSGPRNSDWALKCVEFARQSWSCAPLKNSLRIMKSLGASHRPKFKDARTSESRRPKARRTFLQRYWSAEVALAKLGLASAAMLTTFRTDGITPVTVIDRREAGVDLDQNHPTPRTIRAPPRKPGLDRGPRSRSNCRSGILSSRQGILIRHLPPVAHQS